MTSQGARILAGWGLFVALAWTSMPVAAEQETPEQETAEQGIDRDADAEEVAAGESLTIDSEILREIERLRGDIEALLSKLPPSTHERVRALLLANTTSDGAVAPVVQGSSPGGDALAEASGSTDPEAASPETASPRTTSRTTAATTAADGVKAQRPNEPPPAPRRRSRRTPCNSLDLLDENGDGKISAGDRHWRFLYVWIDRNRDGRRQDKEVESAYAAGVREIETGLDVFYRKKGSLGEIRQGDTLLLDLAGNGFGGGRRTDDGVLLVDTDGLGRGGGPKVFDRQGQPVSGVVPFVAGWQMQGADGRRLALTCPRVAAPKASK